MLKTLVVFIIVIFILTIYKNKMNSSTFKNSNKNFINKIMEEKMENISLNAKIITDKGNINIKLFPEVAPFTVLNFTHLAKRGYYDNLKFHRVIADFMIQGGDPTGTGAGGPGYQFGDEFKEEVTFNKKGLIAMANAGKDTNGSQFFITHVETPWLNYKHTIFGEVVSSSDQKIVDKISQDDIIKSIEITGDLDKFLTGENKKITVQIDEFIEPQFGEKLKKY